MDLVKMVGQRDQVQAVARKYLNRDHLLTTVLLPC